MRLSNHGRSVENILLREQRARATGRWPAWRWHDLVPPETDGWVMQMRRQAENGVFVVLVRELDAEPWGRIIHAAIKTVGDATDLTWAEKQRIKNELFGRQRTAIEVFPAEAQKVDGAPMYHMWVLPTGVSLPFGLHV